MIFRRQKTNYFILGILFLVAILVWIAVFAQSNSNLLEVNFFDVGQGDAIFIETPYKHQILIDGGPDNTVLEKLGKEMPFYDRSIDMVILTHPDKDHITGLIEVLRNYDIGQILLNGLERDTQEYKSLVQIIKQKNIPVAIVHSGQVINFGKEIKMRILWPEMGAVLFQGADSNINNTSIVTKLLYGNSEFLFTGDIEEKVERILVDTSGNQLQSDILKVAHHGSKTSSCKEFLQKVAPEIAIISVGKKNPYGHPHAQVLERLAKFQIYRTDKHGDIEVLTDGFSFSIHTQK